MSYRDITGIHNENSIVRYDGAESIYGMVQRANTPRRSRALTRNAQQSLVAELSLDRVLDFGVRLKVDRCAV